MIKAKYTIVLDTLLNDSESKKLIDKALSTYQLYTPENEEKFTRIISREEINEMLLEHYRFREIGSETFGRFLHDLEHTMKLRMNYYNQLFMSEDIMNGLDDLFKNVDIEEKYTQTTEDTSTNDTTTSETSNLEGSETGTGKNTTETSTSGTGSATDSSTTSASVDNDGKKVKSDTPQNTLNITAKNIDSIPYASEVNWNKDHSSSTGSSSGTSSNTTSSEGSSEQNMENNINRSEDVNKEGTISSRATNKHTNEHSFTRKGNYGVNTYSHDMLKFRQLFVNVVEQIIEDNEIQKLFMQIY